MAKNSQVMDPKKYFIVTFALFSNGEVCDLPYRKLNGLFFNLLISPPRLQTQLVSMIDMNRSRGLFLPNNRMFPLATAV